MNSKQRVYAALEGRPVDRFPVTVLYNYLYYRDHFEELTGRPRWEMTQWLYSSPEAHVETFSQLYWQAPFEFLQPEGAVSRRERAHAEFVELDGKHYRRDRRNGTLVLLDIPGAHPVQYEANQTQYVFDKRGVDEEVRAVEAEERIAQGANDFIEAIVAAFGQDCFILSGGVVGTIYSCGGYLGQVNALAMLKTDPELMDYLCQKITEATIEHIRQFAAAGGDGIYIDDATATSDMISVKDYERFSLPYMKMMVDEIHRLGHKAIIIYFGGVMDRLEQIASIGADGLSVETSMKGYTNDIDVIADRIGQRVTVFGNVDPYGILERASDEELEREVARQVEAGRKARGFVLCTGSPITPRTPIGRVQRFLELGARLGRP